MNELINKICALDEQVRKNREYMEFVYTAGVRHMATNEMCDNAISLGDVTMKLLVERARLTDELYKKYGIIYLIEAR